MPDDVPNLTAALNGGDPPASGPVEENGLGQVMPAGSGEIDAPTEEDSMSFVLDAFDATDDEGTDEIPEEQVAKPSGEGQPEAVPQQVAPPVTPPENVQPTQPAPQEQVVPAAQPPGATQEPQAAPGQQPPVQAGPSDQGAFQALQQAVNDKREAYIQATASDLESTFTDEDIDEFHNDPKKALSKMGARLHHDVVSNILGMVAAHIPQEVARITAARDIHREREEKFFADFPHLKAHRNTVMQVAPLVRQLNPKADDAEFARLLAMAAQMQAGVNPQAQVPTAPQAPARRAPAFQPAGGRQPAPNVQQQRPANGSADYWGGMDEIIEATENGRFMDL